jgi:protein O-mannosyl-transferase
MNGPPERSGLRFLGAAVPVGVIVFIAFAPTLFNGFVASYDDGPNLLTNPNFRGLGRQHLIWAWTTNLLGVYQPFGWMFFELEYAIWRLDAWGYHLVSVVFHLLNAIVLIAIATEVLDRIGADEPRWNLISAAIAVLLFAVHPLRVEPVAWVSAQSYLPCSLFALLAILTYIRANAPGHAPIVPDLALAFLFFTLAVLLKAVAVSVPAVLIILDFYPLRRIGEGSPNRWIGPEARRVWLQKAPFIALSGAFALAAIWAKQMGIRLSPLPDGFPARLTQASYSACFYLIKTVWPVGVSSDYKLPNEPYALQPLFWASLLTVLLVTAAAVRFRRIWPGAAAVWAVYLVTLAPNSGLIRTTDQVATDRYSYVPTMAMFVAVSYPIARLGRTRLARRTIVAAAVLTIGTLITLTWRQCKTWRDDVALYQRVVAVSPLRAEGHNSLGLALDEKGLYREAEEQFRIARDLDPHFPQPSNNIARIRLREQKYEDAQAYLEESLSRDPSCVDAHTNMGFLLTLQGKWSAAVPWYQKALNLDPSGPQAQDAHRFLAAALHRLGQDQEALSHYREALRLDPQDTATRRAISEMLNKMRSGAPKGISKPPA